MASINISEEDFIQVAGAANDAKSRGDMRSANALDKIARKINAALSKDNACAKIARAVGGQNAVLRWQDVPSVLL